LDAVAGFVFGNQAGDGNSALRESLAVRAKDNSKDKSNNKGKNQKRRARARAPQNCCQYLFT
jgi:hypothetical protein